MRLIGLAVVLILSMIPPWPGYRDAPFVSRPAWPVKRALTIVRRGIGAETSPPKRARCVTVADVAVEDAVRPELRRAT